MLLGWDTDQFPTDLYDTALAMYSITRAGGFKKGGLNFDAKVRRQSIDPVDPVHAHIGGMDAFARGLKIAAKMIADKRLAKFVQQRYAAGNRVRQEVAAGKMNFAQLEKYTLENVEPRSIRPAEMLENILNEYM